MQELIIDYSDCQSQAPLRNATDTPEFNPIPSGKVSSSFKPSNRTPDHGPTWQRHTEKITYGSYTKQTPTTICTLQFVIPEDIHPPILFYYRLTNFYQNHRRYVKSLDTDQLKGTAVTYDTIKGGSCDPLRFEEKTKRPYYPCGLVANSLFNDTFRNLTPVGNSRNNKTYELFKKGISWASDKALYGNTKYKPQDIAVPPNWQERWGPDGYTDENLPPNLDQDEEFQVWMRSAGLPAFSKLSRRNDHDILRAGAYQMEIELSMSINQ